MVLYWSWLRRVCISRRPSGTSNTVISFAGAWGTDAERIARRLAGDNGPARVVPYAAEAGQFQEAGFSTVICGPGSIEQAHQPDEFVEHVQMERGAAFAVSSLTLAPGETSVTFTPADFPQLAVRNPKLWWPNGYGAPDLHMLHLTAGTSDAKDVRFGMREVTYELSLMDHQGALRRVLLDPSKARSLGQQIVEAAEAGANIATMPFAVFKQLVKHPLTDIGLEKFLQDWKSLHEELQKGA